jgi:hypothetical protein
MTCGQVPEWMARFILDRKAISYGPPIPVPINHFTTSPLHHFTTSPLHHFTTSPLHHFTTACARVAAALRPCGFSVKTASALVTVVTDATPAPHPGRVDRG